MANSENCVDKIVYLKVRRKGFEQTRVLVL